MSRGLLFLVSLFCVLPYATSELNEEPRSETWHGSMQSMARLLTEIIPTLSQPEVFTTPEEKTMVLEKLREFSKTAHAVNMNKTPPSSDPVFKAVSKNLKERIDGAVLDMEKGRWSAGRRKALSATQNCVACHTMKGGPSSVQYEAFAEKLSKSQKANFYAATRQFDNAIINYEYVLADKEWARTHEPEWNEALQRLLAITVRVKNDPNLSMELISRFFDSNTYPKKLKHTAQIWRQHTKEWAKEKNRNLVTIHEINKIVGRAEKLQGKNPDPVSLLLFLRASAKVHTFLENPIESQNQEALLLAGRIAEGLRDTNFWTFPEIYYEACASVDNKSTWGAECENKLKKSQP